MGVVVGLCWVERAVHLRDLRAEFDCCASCEHHDEITGERSLRHVHSCRLSPFAIGPFCNVISAVIRLPNPVPCDGALSCWKLPGAVRGQILQQLLPSPPPTIQHVSPAGGAQLPRAWPLPWAGQLENPTVERDPILLPERKPRTNKRAKGSPQVVAENQNQSRPKQAAIIVEDDLSDDSDEPPWSQKCPPTRITPVASSKPAAGSVFERSLIDRGHRTHTMPAAGFKPEAAYRFQTKMAEQERSNVIDCSVSPEPERTSIIDVQSPSNDASSKQLQRNVQHAVRCDKPPESERSQDVPVTGLITYLKRKRYKADQDAEALLPPTPVRHRPAHAVSAYRQLAPSTSCLKDTLHTLSRPTRDVDCDYVRPRLCETLDGDDSILDEFNAVHRKLVPLSNRPMKQVRSLGVSSANLPRGTPSHATERIGTAVEEASPLAQQNTWSNRDATFTPQVPPLEQTLGVGSRSLPTERSSMAATGRPLEQTSSVCSRSLPTERAGTATTGKNANLPVQHLTWLDCDSAIANQVSPQGDMSGVGSRSVPTELIAPMGVGSKSLPMERIGTPRVGSRSLPMERTAPPGIGSRSPPKKRITTTGEQECLPAHQNTKMNCDSTVDPPAPALPQEATLGVSSSALSNGSFFATHECANIAREEASPPTRSFKRLRRPCFKSPRELE